jgi:hypothetical protein
MVRTPKWLISAVRCFRQFYLVTNLPTLQQCFTCKWMSNRLLCSWKWTAVIYSPGCLWNWKDKCPSVEKSAPREENTTLQWTSCRSLRWEMILFCVSVGSTFLMNGCSLWGKQCPCCACGVVLTVVSCSLWSSTTYLPSYPTNQTTNYVTNWMTN